TKADNPGEYDAWKQVLLQARSMPADELAEQVHAGVTGRQMYESERGKYRGQVVRVTGQLKRLIARPAPPELEKVGIPELYEAWILDQFSFEKPVCAIGTELPAGIKAADEFKDIVWVT